MPTGIMTTHVLILLLFEDISTRFSNLANQAAIPEPYRVISCRLWPNRAPCRHVRNAPRPQMA
jgi:hypothetical protein